MEKNSELIEVVTGSSQRRIIVSTNIIETGFTVPDLGFVVDSLKFLHVYYNPVKKMDIMRFMPIDKNM